jgi:MFS family permease
MATPPADPHPAGKPSATSGASANGPGRAIGRLAVFFSAIYVVQAIAEPSEGTIVQPVRALLRSWGQSTAGISAFTALLAIPWALKPLYGLLSDSIPLFGSRRKSYLVATCGLAALAFGVLACAQPEAWGSAGLFFWLLVATLAIAFADVVADALMVEVGQPLGLTGRLQALQWGSLYAATIAGGPLGGLLTERHWPRLGFLICGALCAATLALALWSIDEPATKTKPKRRGAGSSLRLLWQAARSPAILALCAYLFLWNFNPCSTTAVHLYMTGPLGLSEPFYGHSISLMAVASCAASLSYAAYCRMVPMRLLVHASIVLGIAANLAYAALADAHSALLVTLLVGFANMTATLIQLDLAARLCPPEVAGTTFALLMSVSNFGAILATWLGGRAFEAALLSLGQRGAFVLLALAGAGATATCWATLPWLAQGYLAPGSPSLSNKSNEGA